MKKFGNISYKRLLSEIGTITATEIRLPTLTVPEITTEPTAVTPTEKGPDLTSALLETSNVQSTATTTTKVDG